MLTKLDGGSRSRSQQISMKQLEILGQPGSKPSCNIGHGNPRPCDLTIKGTDILGRHYIISKFQLISCISKHALTI